MMYWAVVYFLHCVVDVQQWAPTEKVILFVFPSDSGFKDVCPFICSVALNTFFGGVKSSLTEIPLL